jgi:hypothetical protein
MKCDRCSQTIDPNEAQEHFGQNLCEDCYMDALSPAKTCDPWAVHSAQSLAKSKGGTLDLSDIQQHILRILKGRKTPNNPCRFRKGSCSTEAHGEIKG